MVIVVIIILIIIVIITIVKMVLTIIIVSIVMVVIIILIVVRTACLYTGKSQKHGLAYGPIERGIFLFCWQWRASLKSKWLMGWGLMVRDLHNSGVSKLRAWGLGDVGAGGSRCGGEVEHQYKASPSCTRTSTTSMCHSCLLWNLEVLHVIR